MHLLARLQSTFMALSSESVILLFSATTVALRPILRNGKECTSRDTMSV